MLTSEVLDGAADQIRARGLWQGQELDDTTTTDPGTCAANAIFDAAGCDYMGSRHARRAVVQHLGLDIPEVDFLEAIFAWNDHPDRTAAEVIEVLRATAVIESARESQLVEVTR